MQIVERDVNLVASANRTNSSTNRVVRISRNYSERVFGRLVSTTICNQYGNIFYVERDDHRVKIAALDQQRLPLSTGNVAKPWPLSANRAAQPDSDEISGFVRKGVRRSPGRAETLVK